MARQTDTIAAIDLGTYRTCCVIGEIVGPDMIDVIGIGSRRTNGIRKGVIVNLEALVATIRGAVEQAESMAGRTVDAAVATVPAAQIRSFTSRGVVTITNRDRVVGRKDLSRVLETVRAVQIPAGQSILHTLPQEYTLDGQDGIQDPVGMTGSRLESSVHVVTVPTQAAQHVCSALNKSNIEVISLIYPLLASAQSVLSPEEKEQGVFLIDCGGGTTDVALFERGALWFTGSLPVAGELVSNDISIGLRTPVPDAEQIKRSYARAIPSDDDDDIALEVPSVGGGPARVIAGHLLTQIVAPRIQEVFELAKEMIDRVGLGDRARAGAVIVGGSANLAGLAELAEEVLGVPVRIGIPYGTGGLLEDVRAPSFATPVGLTLWELRQGRRERAREMTARPTTRVFEGLTRGFNRASNWIGEMF